MFNGKETSPERIGFWHSDGSLVESLEFSENLFLAISCLL